MRSLKLLLGAMFALLIASGVSVVAQDKSSQSTASYVPSLGDVMSAIQLRHSKLWYAAKQKNWPLADYELVQLDESLKKATRSYANMPSSDMITTDKLVILVGEAIRTKNDSKFDQAFAQMTAECNSCHKAAGRDFIYVRRPPFASPYSNQMFAPLKR